MRLSNRLLVGLLVVGLEAFAAVGAVSAPPAGLTGAVTQGTPDAAVPGPQTDIVSIDEVTVVPSTIAAEAAVFPWVRITALAPLTNATVEMQFYDADGNYTNHQRTEGVSFQAGETKEFSWYQWMHAIQEQGPYRVAIAVKSADLSTVYAYQSEGASFTITGINGQPAWDDCGFDWAAYRATRSIAAGQASAHQGQFFPETGLSVGPPFLAYFYQDGGVGFFGFPVTAAEDRGGLRTQRFERAVLISDQSNGVRLADLSWSNLQVDVWPNGNQLLNYGDRVVVDGTGVDISGPFLAFFSRNGGLNTFGYPLAEPRQEGGRWVQYFQRARLEYLPERAGTAQEVQLGLLDR